jgi:hypothetical protein
MECIDYFPHHPQMRTRGTIPIMAMTLMKNPWLPGYHEETGAVKPPKVHVGLEEARLQLGARASMIGRYACTISYVYIPILI